MEPNSDKYDDHTLPHQDSCFLRGREKKKKKEGGM